MHLMTDYEKYDTFYPSVYVLASFWVCLTTGLIYSLLFHGFFTCDACHFWMDFKTICWLILVDYVMHLCPYLFMIQLLFFSWVYSLFVPKVHNQENNLETLKLCLLYWVLFEIVLACFFSLGNNFWHKQILLSCLATLIP